MSAGWDELSAVCVLCGSQKRESGLGECRMGQIECVCVLCGSQKRESGLGECLVVLRSVCLVALRRQRIRAR